MWSGQQQYNLLSKVAGSGCRKTYTPGFRGAEVGDIREFSILTVWWSRHTGSGASSLTRGDQRCCALQWFGQHYLKPKLFTVPSKLPVLLDGLYVYKNSSQLSWATHRKAECYIWWSFQDIYLSKKDADAPLPVALNWIETTERHKIKKIFKALVKNENTPSRYVIVRVNQIGTKALLSIVQT